jgi:hypothetical protein
MPSKKRIIFPILLLFLATLACSLPITGNNNAETNIEETAAAAVVGTLTALAPDFQPSAEETETPLPTETPQVETQVEPTTEIPKSTNDLLRVAAVDSNGNLVVWEEGGSELIIISSGDVSQVSLSSDGEWIAFTHASADEIDTSLWVVRFDGSEEKLLVSHTDFMAMPLHPDITDDFSILTVLPFMVKFIPGTYTLAFMTYPRFEGAGFMDNKDLYFVDVLTGDRLSELAPGQGGQFYFSPDGSQLALVTPERIDLMNTDGSDRRIGVLTYPFVYTYSEYAYHAMPIWSQDSSYLMVSIPPQDPLADATASVNIYHINTDGSPASLITSFVVSPLDNAFLAPDLTHFAFKQQIGDPGDNLHSLKLANLSGGPAVEFTSGSLGFGTWAPDSSHFYYVDWNSRDIYIGQVEDPGIVVVNPKPAIDFRWITGETYFFVYQSGSNYQLHRGTLAPSSEVIIDLGSGPSIPSYTFVNP